MIRKGKNEGWLKWPSAALWSWAKLNGVKFDGISVGSIRGLPERGTGILAARALKGGEEGPLMVIPSNLVLSLEQVEIQAKSDKHLQEILGALGEYARTARGAILVFLLHQATIANPKITETVGTTNPFTEYIKFLPEELLPTFWFESERDLLVGTSLKPALEAKLKSLQKEFDHLRAATEDIAWCSKYWWDAEDGLLSFDDWLQVDSMYRSRALEFPGIGDSMVPCIDMANHATEDATAALYETDGQGNAILLLRDHFNLNKGDEITITYGDRKGACEMIFSYGFLEENMTSAKEIFLDLGVPTEDPLGLAKIRVSNAAPGVKLSESEDGVEWYSDFIYLIIVNEEDGLEFRVSQTISGDRELQTLWKGTELQDTSMVRDILQGDPMWDIYQLRAVVLIQQRVAEQIDSLIESKNVEDFEYGEDKAIRKGPRGLAVRLRQLELKLLEMAYESLEKEKLALVETDGVQRYLAASAEGAEPEQDFT